MAATERIMGSLHQSRSAMGSSAILSFKPLHPSREFGRPCKKFLPSAQASKSSTDDRSTTLQKTGKESRTRSSSVSSLLKAVQEGGSSVVLQQVSSIRHFFTPELPHAIITEIKKRMALSFKDQDDEENAIQDDLNGGLLEHGPEAQVTFLGPRCAWPRLKLKGAETERQEEAIGGPRCAWPRAAQARSTSSGAEEEQWKRQERRATTIGEGASGTSRNYYESNKSSQLEGLMNPLGGLEKEALSKRVEEGEEEAMGNNSVIEGPRCPWPRSTTPRRMLATGVGLSLINYLFIAQGASALAILLEPPLPYICEEPPSLSTPHKNLLP